MSDKFTNVSPSITAPFTHAEGITPNDGADLADVTRGLNAATSGNVRVTMLDDSVATLHIAAGIALPVRVKRVWATGTTAAGIVGLS